VNEWTNGLFGASNPWWEQRLRPLTVETMVVIIDMSKKTLKVRAFVIPLWQIIHDSGRRCSNGFLLLLYWWATVATR
jgi:hypothetical protein